MARKAHIVDSCDNALFQQFNRDPTGDEMAHLLASITMNWAKLEQALYLSMKSIDAVQADVWRNAFFSAPVLSARKDKARKSIHAVVSKSYPKLLLSFEQALDGLEAVQHRRNALCHGLWLPIKTAGLYPVQPLRYDKATAIFDPIVIVDLKFLSDLLEDMIAFTQRIYSVGAELLAHQQLKKAVKR